MMAISDVSPLYFLKFFLKEPILSSVKFPQYMNNRHICLVLVLFNDTVGLLRLCQMGDFLLNRCVFTRSVRQENGAYIRTLNVRQKRPVFFLLFKCFLVLLNEIVFVVSNCACGHEPDLLATLHLLRVDVEAGSAVLLEPLLLDEVLKVALAGGIHQRRVGVCVLW